MWFSFRGGKGVATAIGGFAVLSTGAVLTVVAAFVVVVAATRFVSLGSITAACLLPLVLKLLFHVPDAFVVAAAIDDLPARRLAPGEHPAAPRRDRAPPRTEGNLTQIAIVGTGAWGTALAVHAANAGHDVRLLGRREEVVGRLSSTRQHPALRGAPPIPEKVRFTLDPAEAFEGAAAVLWSVSVQATAGELVRLERALPKVPLVATSKGIEIGTRRRTTEIMAFVTGRTLDLAVLSGPTFAAEVARALPAAAVVASPDPEVSRFVQGLLSSPTMRLYRSEDVLGVEIAGAAKNVIAIAAGILDGLKLGHNTRAAMLTRALAEIRRLGTQLGGAPETFYGLAGVGDLILTATGDLSRNRRVGLALATGQSLSEALASLGGEVAEGVATAPALLELAAAAGVEMPISEMVRGILAGETAPMDAVRKLMTRALKEEKV